METNAPSKLKSKLRFYPINQIGETTWGILKAKLTGKKSKFGHFYSEVNLSESDVDKLIENIKKSGEYPNLEDESNDNLEIYQNWLVDTYLKSASTEYKSNGDSDKEEKNENVKVESKKESAPPLYEGVRETDLVDEEIDERILEILGLEEVYDFTYGEYKQLLFTELQKIDRGEEKSVDRAMLLQDEFKRIKGKVGKFKLKKKKITAESIGITGPIQISKDKFFVTSRAIVPTTPTSIQESSKDITDIEKALDDILKSLTLQNKEKKKRTDEERKKSEDRRRRQREGDLEKPLTQLKSLAKKIIAPAQGILDRIFRFIKFTLLGYAFNQLVKWFNDPKNADKIKVLGRFLKDWWPTLLSAYVLFATPFGAFIRGTLKLLRGFIPQILKIIPQLARFAVANPVTTAAVVATVGGITKIKESERMKPLTQKSQEEIDKTLQSKESPWYQKLGAGFAEQSLNAPGGPKNPIGLPTPSAMYNGGGLIGKRSFFGGGLVDREIDVNDIAFEGGGGISNDSGVKITGAGPDTQLIAAQPGEVMMSKKAVDKHGANFFLNLNKKAGGTNIPKIANNIQLAAGGGMIGKPSQSTSPNRSGGRVNNVFSTVSNIGKSVFQNLGGMISADKTGSSNFSSGAMVSGGKTGSSNVSSSGMISSGGNVSSNFSSSGMVSGDKTGTSNVSSSGMSLGNGFNGFSGRGFSGLSPISSSSGGFKSSMKPMNYNVSNRFEMNPLSVTNSNVFGGQSYSQPNIIQYDAPIAKLKSTAPGPPVIISKTTFTVLPPTKAPSKEPSISRGSKLPAFNISAESDSRSNIATKLGIRDLVGVS